MDYFERLILRALALPRGGTASVFDPFDQVAPSLPASAPAHGPLAEGITLAAAPVATIAVPVQARDPHAATELPSAAQTASSPLPAPASATPSPQPPPAAPWPAETLTPTPAVEIRPSHGEPAPLAVADAFMHRLGVAPVSTMVAPKAHEPLAMTVAVEPSEVPADPARPASAPLLATPLRPPPPPEAPARRAPGERRAPAQEPPPTPASPRDMAGQGQQRGAPERIVQTTLLVSRTAPRTLDDLAHSSAISRFGLGQW